MTGGILNPPQEAAVCRRMIAAIEAQMAVTTSVLTTRTLSHEDYLQAIARRIALAKAVEELTGIYNKEFNV